MPNDKLISGKLKKISDLLSQSYKVKIGLLANQGGSDPVSENLDLAGLGAIHEFGCDIKITKKMAAFLAAKAKELGLPKKQGKGDGYVHIPARSWLYQPLMNGDFKKTIFDYIGDFELFKEVADEEELKKLAKLIGEVGLFQIQKAFENHGIDGEWAPNSPMTIAGKGSSAQLIDKGYLRKRMTYKVEKNV